MVGILKALEMSSTFLLSKLKPALINHLGIDGLFLFFAAVLALVILFTKAALPKETIAKRETSKMENKPFFRSHRNSSHKKNNRNSIAGSLFVNGSSEESRHL